MNNHYKSADPNIQVFDVLENYGLDFNAYVSQAVQYLFRFNKKGEPLKDLQKSIDFLNQEIKQERKLVTFLLRAVFSLVGSNKLKFEKIISLFSLTEFQAKTFELILARKYALAIVEINSEIKKLQGAG